MPYTADQLIVLASNLEALANELLVKDAAKKDSEKEMTDEEWAKKNTRIIDWSNKDWSEYNKIHKDKWEKYKKEKEDTNNAKDKKKLDPSAKVRNRGPVCVPAEQAKDKKDHFPINDEGQARSALSRVEGLTSAPWYKGSLEGLRALVKRKVKAKYPKINVGGKDKKKSSAI